MCEYQGESRFISKMALPTSPRKPPPPVPRKNTNTRDETKASKRSSRSISNFPTSSPSAPKPFQQCALRVHKTFSSPIVSIGTSRTDSSRLALGDNELLATKDIKNECFQWGAGKKILERPKLLRGKHIKHIKCGGSHTMALLEDGSVYTWGDGRCGQLGHGSNTKATEQPLLLKSLLEPVVEIYAGFTQSAFITESGKLFYCGIIGREIKFEPENCPAFDNVKVQDIAFGPSCIGKENNYEYIFSIFLIFTFLFCSGSWLYYTL